MIERLITKIVVAMRRKIKAMENYFCEPVNSTIDKVKYYRKAENDNFGRDYKRELLTVNNVLCTFEKKFLTLYEDKINNRISESSYKNITFKMRRKQEELIKRRNEIESMMNY